MSLPPSSALTATGWRVDASPGRHRNVPRWMCRDTTHLKEEASSGTRYHHRDRLGEAQFSAPWRTGRRVGCVPQEAEPRCGFRGRSHRCVVAITYDTTPRIGKLGPSIYVKPLVGAAEELRPTLGSIAREISNGLKGRPPAAFSTMLTGRPQAGHFHSAPVDTVHGPAKREAERAVYLLATISSVSNSTMQFVTGLQAREQSRFVSAPAIELHLTWGLQSLHRPGSATGTRLSRSNSRATRSSTQIAGAAGAVPPLGTGRWPPGASACVAKVDAGHSSLEHERPSRPALSKLPNRAPTTAATPHSRLSGHRGPATCTGRPGRSDARPLRAGGLLRPSPVPRLPARCAGASPSPRTRRLRPMAK